MFKICLPRNLKLVHVMWIVTRNPIISVRHPRNVMCSLPIGRMCSVKAFQPPSDSIHWPASSFITEKAESTTDCMTSDCPDLAQSTAIADEIVMKLMILPQVISLCLNNVRPMLSTITGAASGRGIETLQNVRGWSRSSSVDIRFMITMMWRSAALGRTSIWIENFLFNRPSRFSRSLMKRAQRHWI